MYVLGVDLGTTFTAAATWRDGRAEVATLGSRAASVPSVVLLREDETVLTGEPASRRGLSEPHRVSREFKRRLGDTTPILLGGTPYSAEALMSRLLRWTVDQVIEREGGPPSRICLCHPANWGPYKRELLDQAVRLASIDQPVTFTTEPEAAAVFYAQQQRIEPGSIVAVYDLGGGTFDAAVLRKTATGFEILGQPEGIERLGGIDFDAAVFGHVRAALDGKLDELDPEDAATLAAVARLREECVTAKEALSSDTDASIPVLLPNVSTEVRITRSELEAMVRPALHSSIEAMRRALRSADVEPEQLHSVLLVGGSSRMPLVAQLVGAELGRPVAVDAHPKHAIALGAAWLASGAATGRATAAAAPVTAPAAGGTAAAGTAGRNTAAVAGAGVAAAAVAGAVVAGAGVAATTGAASAHTSAPVRSGTTGGTHSGHTYGTPTQTTAAAAQEPLTALVSPVASDGPPQPATTGGRSRRNLLIGAGTLVAALAVSGVAVAMSGGGQEQAQPPVDPGTSASADPGQQSPGVGSPEPSQTEPQLPADERCTDEIMANERWVCLTSATFDGTELVIEYQADWAGGTPATGGGFHLHLYGGDGVNPPEEIMGSHAAQQGSWQVEDRSSPLRFAADHRLVTEIIGEHPKVCARIADPSHALVPAGDGYRTGNCVAITRS